MTTAFMVEDLLINETYEPAQINEIVQKPIKIAALGEIIENGLQQYVTVISKCYNNRDDLL